MPVCHQCGRPAIAAHLGQLVEISWRMWDLNGLQHLPGDFIHAFHDITIGPLTRERFGIPLSIKTHSVWDRYVLSTREKVRA